MTIQNPLTSLATYLKADPAVAALASTRVYVAETPWDEATNQPRYAVAIWPTGGRHEHYVPLQPIRVDIICYGATHLQGHTLFLAVYEAMKNIAREDNNDTLLHVATQSAGPLTERDPRTHWPYTWSSWLVTAGEETTDV